MSARYKHLKPTPISYRCQENPSLGEIKCFNVLRELGIKFLTEVTIKLCEDKRFDFFFEDDEESYLIEIDGGQHHTPNNDFDKSDFGKYRQRRYDDVVKSQKCIEEGYKLIRIVYNDIDDINDDINNIPEIIQEAKISNKRFYTRHLDLYQHVTKNLEPETY